MNISSLKYFIVSQIILSQAYSMQVEVIPPYHDFKLYRSQSYYFWHISNWNWICNDQVILNVLFSPLEVIAINSKRWRVCPGFELREATTWICLDKNLPKRFFTIIKYWTKPLNQIQIQYWRSRNETSITRMSQHDSVHSANPTLSPVYVALNK